jgi:glycosyltransferase involved in cell wall biosynthesis
MASLRDRLVSRGYRVSLVAITKSQRVDQPDVFYPSGKLALLKTVRHLRADVVHVHVGGDLSTRMALLCASVAWTPGARSLMTFHSGGFPSSPKGRSASPLSIEGLALRQLHAVIAVNAEIAELFHRYGIPSDRISTIAPHQRIDRSRIPSTLPATLETFYAAHDPVFVAVGMLEPEYTLSLQIEAMPSIRARWPRAGLVLIGSGSLEATLRQQIATAGLAADILLHGNLDHPYTLRAIERATVLLRTTQYDGDAVSVREALQLGTAVVASNNGMRPPGVELLPRFDVSALVNSCVAAIASPPLVGNASGGDSVVGADPLDTVLDLYERVLR